MVSFDDVLVLLGEFGKYQKRIYFLLCLPAISCALHKLSGVFLQAEVPHRCQLPNELQNASYFLPEDVLKANYPWDSLKKHYSYCSYFDSGQANDTVECSSWIYDKSTYQSTTKTDWDLVCTKGWYHATSDAILMAGVMLGSIIFGDLSDRMGRKLIFFISLVMQVVFGVLVAIAPDIYTFMFARLVVGATTSGVFLVAYVLALEMVGPKTRMVAGVVFQMFFTAGFLLTALFAYFIREWRYLQLAMTLPGLAFLTYWWFIPESVRWLLNKRRYNEGKAILRSAAKENRKIVSEVTLDELVADYEKDKQKQSDDNDSAPSLIDIFKYPNLRKKTIIILCLWFINSGSYYGLSWNTSNLGGNEYLNFTISGIVEIPAYVALLLTLNRFGRKAMLCGCMILAGVCLLATVFVPEDMRWLSITLAMAGKMAVTASYGTVYIFSAEQFPTVVRSVGLGAASTFARFGGIAAPYVNLLANSWKPLPLIIFGVLVFVGGSAALVLPETLNMTLPETIEEGENFGRKPEEEVTMLPKEASQQNGQQSTKVS